MVGTPRCSDRPERDAPHNGGAWRDDSVSPTQVVSGPVGRERVHFEAPGAARLDEEMRRFLEWYEGGATTSNRC